MSISMSDDQILRTKGKVLNIIKRLRDRTTLHLEYEEVRRRVSVLAKEGIYQTYSLPTELLIHRARLLNDPAKDKECFTLKDLGPPKPEETHHYGRCNQPNRPVCYCSLYEDIALAEVEAKLEEQYVISAFDVAKDIVLIPIGEFDWFRRTGETYLGQNNPDLVKPYKNGLTAEDWLMPAVIDAFLADEFITQADDRKITSAFSDVLLSGDLEPKIPIDAIVYPSVAFRGGINFAILPFAFASKMKLVEGETKIIKITEAVGYGIYDYQVMATLKSYNSEGILTWSN